MHRGFKGFSLLLMPVLSLLLTPSLLAGGDPIPAQASASPTIPVIVTQPQLSPFKAYYQAQFDLGINVSGEATRELSALPDGQWQLSMKASALMARIEESSRFEIRQQQLRPLEYRYQRKVFTNKKQLRQLFDWANGTLVSTFKEHSAVLQIEQQTYDNVSYQIQLWRDLSAGMSEMHYTLADRDQLKTLEFDRVGEEIIVTPAGQFKTIKVRRDRGEGSARKTTLWFAKGLEHLIVKLEQIETDGKQYVLLLERLETP